MTERGAGVKRREKGFFDLLWAGGRLAGLGLALSPLLACGGFFQCENKTACPATSTTGSGTTTSSTLDLAFVSYTTSAGSSVITGYNLANGTLAAVNTVTLPFVPLAIAVNAKNSILYVASVPGYTNPGIYAYTIGTDGTLTASGSTPLIVDQIGAMTISSDGNYLYTLETQNQTMTQYTVNSSTGALTTSGALTVLALSCAPTVATVLLPACGVAVSPKGDFVTASLGQQGDAFFQYSSTGGVPNQSFATVAAGTNSGDFAVAMDSSDNAYVAQTNTLTVYGVASTGITNRGVYTFPAGSIPRSTVVDSTSSFVYTAAVGTSKITGFATGTTTALTLLSNSPYSAPANVAALGIDKTDAYLVGVGYDATAGVQLYSIAPTTGALAALASAPTSTATTYPVLVAMTH